MTKSVIMVGVMDHPVTELLAKWPSRRAIRDDARAAEPGLELVAVHRWFSRHTIPSRYWRSLIDGAVARGMGSPEQMMAAFIEAHAASKAA